MKPNDRVELSVVGKEKRHIFKSSDIQGTVVRPGISRGGLYLRVLIDGEKIPRTFAATYWQSLKQGHEKDIDTPYMGSS